MAVAILLPKLGLTMTEGTINEWLVAPGASVNAGDPLLMLATDKVDVEVEAEGEGVFHPSVEAGVTLPPGAVVGRLLEAGEQPPADDTPTAAAPVAEATAAGSAAAAAVDEPGAVTAAVGAVATNASDRHRSSPNARRVAGQHRVDVTAVRGTGPGGRVV